MEGVFKRCESHWRNGAAHREASLTFMQNISHTHKAIVHLVKITWEKQPGEAPAALDQSPTQLNHHQDETGVILLKCHYINR